MTVKRRYDPGTMNLKQLETFVRVAELRQLQQGRAGA